MTAVPAAPTAAPPLLRVRDLSVDFGVDRAWQPAARGLSFEIRPGQILALVGESGSGKSASAMSLLGLLPPNSRVSGVAELDGESLLDAGATRRRQIRGGEIAAIFQEPMTALNPVHTVGAQLVEAVRAHRAVGRERARARALELIELVELPEPERVFRSYPHQLSGGQRQRAMIAQALVHEPRLLIADEPTTALDVTVQAEILELLRSLRDRLGSAVLLITHDMGVVADLADRMVVLRAGRIVEQGAVARVFAHPEHPYTRALLDAVPHLGAARAPAPARSEPRAGAPAERAAEPALRMSGVAIDYPGAGRRRGHRAVEGVTLAIQPGEVLGLVGESGSGKSTIGRAAIGLQGIAAGELRVAGVELDRWSRRTAARLVGRVGIVFQDPTASLNPRLPIGQSIGEPLLLSGEARGAELERRVSELLDAVRLPASSRNRSPHELSGGQKQRVGIARALALRPALLVADEPTSALDVSVQAAVLDTLRSLQAEQGFACLFISHDLAVVDALADRVAVLRAGRVVEQGPREEVLRSPREDYTRRLLAAIPVPDPAEQRARRARRRGLAGPEN